MPPLATCRPGPLWWPCTAAFTGGPARAFVLGLEQAAGTTAEVVGKPAPTFFTAALAHLGARADGTLMVGDDIENDVLGAQRQGLTGVLVKTGKYLPRTHLDASGTPDHVLDSFADLPALLARLR